MKDKTKSQTEKLNQTEASVALQWCRRLLPYNLLTSTPANLFSCNTEPTTQINVDTHQIKRRDNMSPVTSLWKTCWFPHRLFYNCIYLLSYLRRKLNWLLGAILAKGVGMLRGQRQWLVRISSATQWGIQGAATPLRSWREAKGPHCLLWPLETAALEETAKPRASDGGAVSALPPSCGLGRHPPALLWRPQRAFLLFYVSDLKISISTDTFFFGKAAQWKPQ